MLNEQDCSAKGTRPYRMRRRAQLVDRTRQRITEAAVHLHTTVGPASTTISAIAEEARVTRVTVYRHFPDDEALYQACTSHWYAQHPPPDPKKWLQIERLADRAQHGLDQLYAWYAENSEALYLFDRDADVTPGGVQQANRAAHAAAAAALLGGAERRDHRRRLPKAAAGHVVRFSTWRSLAVEESLDHHQTVQLGVRFLLAADSTV